jgi:hypothetical protein
MSTFKLIEFLDAESLLVCQQVAPDLMLERPRVWTPPDVRLKYIEPLPEIVYIMKEPPKGETACIGRTPVIKRRMIKKGGENGKS